MAWDYPRIESMLANSSWEPYHVDFKESLQGPPPQQHDSLVKCAAGFANADGGFLIFGVKDPSRHMGITPSELICGIERRIDVPHELQQRLTGIEPAVWFGEKAVQVAIPGKDELCVAVIDVPKTKYGAHRAPDGTFPIRRTGNGTESMTYSEVRTAMLGTLELAGRVAILRSYLAQTKETARVMVDLNNAVWSSPDRFEVPTLERIAVEACLLLPNGSALFDRTLFISKLCQRANRGIEDVRRYQKDQNIPVQRALSALRDLVRLIPELEEVLEAEESKLRSG